MNIRRSGFFSARASRLRRRSAARLAGAQSYPTKTITVIIPFAGGSASDVVARIMLDKMSKNMGQPIVIENRPGAGGNSGTGAAAKATPDGYTLVGGGSGPVAANVALYKALGYDPEKDLEMIAPFAGFTIVVVASTKLPVHSLKELVEYAKANPGKLNYGSVGIGSSQHLAGEFFSQINGVKLTHVPYRNIAQYGPDLIAGPGAARLPVVPERRRPDRLQGRHSAGGRGRQAHRGAAGHADHHRARHAGIQGAAAGSRLLAPAGTPKPILERLNKEMKAAVEDPQVKKGFETAGAETMWMPLGSSEEVAP